MDTSFLDLFQLLIGIYLGYCALFNKGKIYENANVKEGKEKEYRKVMRVMLLILSPIIIAVGVLGLSGFNKTYGYTLSTVLWVLSLVCFGVLMFLTVRLTDRTKAKAQSGGSGPKKHPGFDFDDEDENPTDGE
ncbi:MAG: hypothetical protein AAGU74_09660 [Bacillota bacterium]